jgi:hypothetical protein
LSSKAVREKLVFFEMLADIGKSMPAEEIAELEQWERENIGGHLGTSDWPGWSKYFTFRELGQMKAQPSVQPSAKTARSPKASKS